MLVQADFTCNGDLHAWMELFLEVSAMEPDNAAGTGVVCQASFEHGCSFVALVLCGFKCAHHRDSLFGLNVRYLFGFWRENVITRIVLKEVVEGVDPELCQNIGLGRPYALDELNRGIWLIG